ncbi:hypothetical protein Vretifemale_8640, partial [Volvox reticuliferus]
FRTNIDGSTIAGDELVDIISPTKKLQSDEVLEPEKPKFPPDEAFDLEKLIFPARRRLARIIDDDDGQVGKLHDLTLETPPRSPKSIDITEDSCDLSPPKQAESFIYEARRRWHGVDI